MVVARQKAGRFLRNELPLKSLVSFEVARDNFFDSYSGIEDGYRVENGLTKQGEG